MESIPLNEVPFPLVYHNVWDFTFQETLSPEYFRKSDWTLLCCEGYYVSAEDQTDPLRVCD